MKSRMNTCPYLIPSQFTVDVNALQDDLDIAWDELSDKQHSEILASLSSHDVKFE